MSTLNPVQVQRLHKIGLTVGDADRAQAFYTQALGFELVSETLLEGPNYSQLLGVLEAKARVLSLRLGEEEIELMQFLNQSGTPIPIDSQSNDLWFQHLAIAVSDMDRAYVHLKPFITESISTEPQTMPASNQAAAGVRAFKLKDPDRHSLELIWFPPDKGQDKWHQHTDKLFLGIDHSAITVADTAESLKFYSSLLGLQVDGSSLNQGQTQADLDGLPKAEVQVTALRPAAGGLGLELLDYQIPGPGRPVPETWKSCDLAHVQVELVVPNLQQAVELLSSSEVEFVSSHLIQFEAGMPYRQACMVKDPSGHAMLLIEL